jgi:uncharacterized protein
MRAMRLREQRALQLSGIIFEPIAFAMFLLGLAIGRARIAESLSTSLPSIRRLGVWAAGVGVLASLAFVTTEDGAWKAPFAAADWLSGVGFVIGGPSLMLAYAAGLIVLLQRPVWRERLAPLAAAGRMPLTNYLMQSVICTTIFYGYGLGLFGRIGVAAGLALSVVIFAAQVMLSVWWFRRFEFGALEWIWRKLAYAGTFSPRAP